MNNHIYTGIIPLHVADYTVNVEYTYTIENDGIGWYEFHGGPYFDKGQEVPRVDDITPVFTDETEEEQQEINSEINHNWDKYAEEIAESIALE